MRAGVLSITLIGGALLVMATAVVCVRAVIRPPITDAHAILEGASESETQVPDQVRDAVYRVERGSGEVGTPAMIRAQVADRLALIHWRGSRALAWHTRTWLLQSALAWEFTEKELLTLYLELLPYEDGIGASRASEFYFDKELAELSAEEVVGLLAFARSPDHFSPSRNPEAARRMQDQLWAQHQRASRE